MPAIRRPSTCKNGSLLCTWRRPPASWGPEQVNTRVLHCAARTVHAHTRILPIHLSTYRFGLRPRHPKNTLCAVAAYCVSGQRIYHVRQAGTLLATALAPFPSCTFSFLKIGRRYGRAFVPLADPLHDNRVHFLAYFRLPDWVACKTEADSRHKKREESQCEHDCKSNGRGDE